MSTIYQAYKLMVLIRHFEEGVEQLFLQGKIMGTAHTCIGEEAVAVGTAMAINQDDYLTSTHRGHGHFLAKGADPKRLLAELYGKDTGYSKGRGGSQMMMSKELSFYGTNGITGASVAFAAGLALHAKQTKQNRIAVAFYGDGASNQGIIHETLNIAALWQLPLVAICEQNGYAMSTPVRDGIATGTTINRAIGYGIPAISIDGNDPLAVQKAVLEAANRARTGGGPTMIEAQTYRHSGHSKGDTGRIYRTREEEQKAWKNDPIIRAEKIINDPTLIATTHAQAKAQIEEAIAYAENSPLTLTSIQEGVFA